jgi:riboflavin kinase/FMN adenylyltransferase
MDDRCVTGLDAIPLAARGGVLAIGNFDGVHLGHQRILHTASGQADAEGLPVVAVTFDPPPEAILRPQQVRKRIATRERKRRLLREEGADWVITIRTSQALLEMAPETFIRDVIVGALAARYVVEGDNFFFGHNREGNVRTLQEWERRGGFKLQVVEPVTLDFPEGPRRVSSSLVRQLVSDGKVEDAARCLGRDFVLSGPIISGEGHGRVLQFPTANIDTGDQVVPADGVYAGRATIGGRQFAAAVSIGCKPTLGPVERAVVEAYLLDAGEDFYGKEMELSFVARLRGQMCFPDIDSLQRQIAKDVQRVREIFQ